MLPDFRSTLLPEFGLVPEGANEAGAFTPDAAQGMGRPAGELPEIAGAQVWQLVLFPISPEVLHRIKFWCVSWETLYPDFTVQAFQVCPNQLTAMGGHAVPDDEQLAFNVTLEVF